MRWLMFVHIYVYITSPLYIFLLIQLTSFIAGFSFHFQSDYGA